MKFKTERQKQEFENPLLDSRLKVIAFAFDGYSQYRFGKEIIITDIHRDHLEQIALYPNLKPEEVPISVHEEWRGLDLRSSIYTDAELKKMEDFYNKSFEYSGGKQTVLLHKVGDGAFHFHLQVDGDGQTILRKI